MGTSGYHLAKWVMTSKVSGKRRRGSQGMRAPRVHLASLGCAKNLVDSERLLGHLAVAGALVGAPPEQADVIIVNTCGFIRPAKEESLATILDVARYKETGPCRKLLVMGCLGQRYKKEIKEQLPQVDEIFGLDEHEAIATACGLRAREGEDAGRLLLTPRHTTYLRITDGCDNRCSYCTIPMIRGPFRSRPVQEILAEAEELVATGARELNLIGQDTTLYGTDLPVPVRIHELLARLAKIRNLRWLRLLYTHPAHFTQQLIDAYASIPKLCPYVDLPLQHVNDDILRRMGRKVTQTDCLALIEQLRTRVPEIAIRTTFIVGFPGETRSQFNELLQLVKQIRFDHLGAFAYSREEKTRAARMGHHVSERAKCRRLRDLMLTQQAIVSERNVAMKGQVLQVVIDGPTSERGVWIARSRMQAPDVDNVTYIRGKRLQPGRFVEAKIIGSRGYDLIGKVLERNEHGMATR